MELQLVEQQILEAVEVADKVARLQELEQADLE
jgi:hypothetical protein